MRRSPIRIPGSLITFATFFLILSASIIVILYGRGYRFDITKKGGSSLRPTGLISATSDPIGAQVFLDNVLKSATNNSFAVDPEWYTVTISKEGYIAWQKKLRVQGEVVTRADAFLFPKNPSLSPLTTTGISTPVLSPDGTKIAYVIPGNPIQDIPPAKAGLWTYELIEGPLGRNRDPQHVGTENTQMDLSTAELSWSPDSTKILVIQGKVARLYTTNRLDAFTDVSTSLVSLKSEWADEKADKERQKLAAFPEKIIDIATSSAHILSFSPDETKILYQASAAATLPAIIDPPLIGTNSTEETRTIEPGNIYVYDTKEDKNFLLLTKSEIPTLSPTPTPTRSLKKTSTNPQPTTHRSAQAGNPQPLPLHWFPTSRHIILTINGKIDIMEYDRTNWATIYAGPFMDEFIAPWSNGSRIIIMTSLIPNAATLPNLYTVNLR